MKFFYKNENELFNVLKDYKFILFDLDNTIYNQDCFDLNQYNSFFLEYFDKNTSLDLSKKLLSRKKQLPYGYKNLFNDFLSDEDLKVDLNSFIKHYKNPNINVLHKTSSLRDLIKRLFMESKELFLITNGYSYTQNIKIDSLQIRHLFKSILILDPTNNIPLKPNDKALSFIDLIKKESIYIGDNLEIDKKFAKNSNIDFLHYQYTREC